MIFNIVADCKNFWLFIFIKTSYEFVVLVLFDGEKIGAEIQDKMITT